MRNLPVFVVLPFASAVDAFELDGLTVVPALLFAFFDDCFLLFSVLLVSSLESDEISSRDMCSVICKWQQQQQQQIMFDGSDKSE